MRNVFRLVAAAAVAAAVSGCVQSQSTTIGDRSYPPRIASHIIDVYIPTEAPVELQNSIANPQPLSAKPQEAKDIGRVDTQGAQLAEWGAVIEDAKVQARQLGGDGIVITAWDYPLVGTNNGQLIYSKALKMTVVRFRP